MFEATAKLESRSLGTVGDITLRAESELILRVLEANIKKSVEADGLMTPIFEERRIGDEGKHNDSVQN